MKITAIEPKLLTKLSIYEGLVIEDCSGNLSHLADDINQIFVWNEILCGNTRFERCYSFKTEDERNLLFLFDEADIDIKRLEMWMRDNNRDYECTYLSDYVMQNFENEMEMEMCLC